MATLKEMISEIFNSEFALDEGQTAGADQAPERVVEPSEPPASEPKEPEAKEPEMSEEDIRKYIREELNQLYNEAKQAKARTTATMTVSNVVEPERTVEDILSDRFKSVMGTTKQKES